MAGKRCFSRCTMSVVSSRLATLHELDTVYSVEDCYDLLEVLAVDALSLLAAHRVLGYALSILAFTMIGAGVGAAGTSLLALLATRVAPSGGLLRHRSPGS